jgi:hypothetical protein
VAETSGDNIASPFVSLKREHGTARHAPRPRPAAKAGRRLAYLLGGSGLVLVGLVVLAALFWKEPETQSAAREEPKVSVPSRPKAQGDAARIEKITSLPADEQVKAVAAWLKERNPDFAGKVTHRIEDGVVTELGFESDTVTDLSPVRALKGLRTLLCRGSPTSIGRLANLWPLMDTSLTRLDCSRTRVSDLSPLRSMNLTELDCSGTPVADLSPLNHLKLKVLNCRRTPVSDLSALRKLPLKELKCDFKPERDAEILRSIISLATINNTPVKQLWQEVDARQAAFEAWCRQVAALSAEKQAEAVAVKLKERNPAFDGNVTHEIEDGVVTELGFESDTVTDISPVRALTGLRNLACRGSWTDQRANGQLADLSPLADMKLTRLDCSRTRVSDLSPLTSMNLKELDCSGTPVADLSPLKDMKLTELRCDRSRVTDLSPLRGMPLTVLACDFKPARDVVILRTLKALEKINNRPAKEFRQEVDPRKPDRKP